MKGYSGYRSDNEVFVGASDQSCLWRATQPLVSSFLETRSVYENGCAETRHFLIRECNLIYECNVCRNMFRNLSSFFKHKRLYCRLSFDHMGGSNGRSSFQNASTYKDEERSDAKRSTEDLSFLLNLLRNEKQKEISNPKKQNNETVQRSLNRNGICRAGLRQNVPTKEATRADEAMSTAAHQTKKTCDICERTFDTIKSLKIHKHRKHGNSISQTVQHSTEVVQQMISGKKTKRKRRISSKCESILERRNYDTVLAESQQRYSPEAAEVSVGFQQQTILTHQNSCRMRNLNASNKKLSPDPSYDAKKTTPERTTENRRQYSAATELPIIPINADAKKSQIVPEELRQSQKLKTKQVACICKICKKHFSALGNLRRHISMFHYRKRRFGCRLCEYRAFRKFDVINHLGILHYILGDKESITRDYITVHEQLAAAREDVDEDVLLITDDSWHKSVDSVKVVKPDSKSLTKSELTSIDEIFTSTAEKNDTQQKSRQAVKRRMCQQLFDSSRDIRSRRPKRTRITPVEKDFVYDLSNILKTDIDSTVPETADPFNLKPGDAVMSTEVASECPSQTTLKLRQKLLLSKSMRNYSVDLIKGASQKIAVSFVNQGRAAYASLPQLPSERPQVRCHIRYTPICHNADSAAVPTNEMAHPEQARIIDDRLLENLSIGSAAVDFKIKPAPVLQQSTINSLLKKVDTKMQKHRKAKAMDVPKLLPKDKPPKPKRSFFN